MTIDSETILRELQAASDEIMGDESTRLMLSTDISDANIDSLTLLEILMMLEEKYDVDLTDLEPAPTHVKDLVSLILKKVG